MNDSAENLVPQDIPLESIFADSDFNCRGVITPIDVRDLATNIQTCGLQQPITVTPVADKPPFKYKIICGHRRFMAFKILQRTSIPAIIRDISDIDAMILNLTENVQRRDLNILQEAKAIERMKRAGLTDYAVASKIGMSRGWVQTRYMLLELPEEIQRDIAAGFMGTVEIRKLYSCASTQQQFELARIMKDNKLNGRRKETVKRVAQMTENEKKARTRGEIRDLLITIDSVFGACFATRALAWASGEISDKEMHESIREYAGKSNRYYSVPAHLK